MVGNSVDSRSSVEKSMSVETFDAYTAASLKYIAVVLLSRYNYASNKRPLPTADQPVETSPKPPSPSAVT